MAARTFNAARHRWQAQYRANRTAQRLWDFLVQKKGKIEGLPSFIENTPGGFAFDATRLHGDVLTWVCEGVCRRNANCHRSLLTCLRHSRMNYPARLPA